MYESLEGSHGGYVHGAGYRIVAPKAKSRRSQKVMSLVHRRFDVGGTFFDQEQLIDGSESVPSSGWETECAAGKRPTASTRFSASGGSK
jgi:hypothetical protein